MASAPPDRRCAVVAVAYGRFVGIIVGLPLIPLVLHGLERLVRRRRGR